jgi:hypothetical protein
VKNKSILFCLVFCVKNKTFLFIFASTKKHIMVISTQIKEKVAQAESGIILTIRDFDIEPQYQAALVKALNRMAATGELKKASKGKYYKPKNTQFGTLKPTITETIKEFLEKDGEITGYITGTAAFASMGLTTQITSAVTIGTNKYRRPMTRGEYRVTFLPQPNPISKEDIPLLRILDAIRLIKEIPAITPDEAILTLNKIISSQPTNKIEHLTSLAERYSPCVRALLGAILENSGLPTYNLQLKLNGVTYYKMPVSNNTLPNKRNWNII